MPELNDGTCNRILEELGYFTEAGSADRATRISIGKTTGPKAFWFAPLTDDETVPVDRFVAYLIREGLFMTDVYAAVDKVIG